MYWYFQLNMYSYSFLQFNKYLSPFSAHLTCSHMWLCHDHKLPLWRPGIDRRIILKIVNRMWGCGHNLPGKRYELMAGSCGHGNEPLGSIKDEKFLHELSDCWVLNNGYNLWSSFIGWSLHWSFRNWEDWCDMCIEKQVGMRHKCRFKFFILLKTQISITKSPLQNEPFHSILGLHGKSSWKYLVFTPYIM
jgi:hypothetical protein